MLDMRSEIREQWCKALRSGEYKQARGDLRAIRNKDGTYSYCCLGVLTDLYVKAGNPENCVWDYETLHDPVKEWAGIASNDPILTDEHGYRGGAAEWNDIIGADFRKIADMIDGGQAGRS